MALASGFCRPPSYTPGASQCAPFFLSFGVGGECCNPPFADYYDYEEYASSGQSPLASSKDYTPSSPLQLPEPDYTPSSPDYSPASPDYTPSSPDYTPSSPDYTPSSPDYTPTSPDYTPASPSQSLVYTSSSPFRLASMMPSPPCGASPDYTPLTPSEHAASSPYYTPLSLGHASSLDYTPPPSPLVVSDAESCASPYYTPSTPSRCAASPDYTPSTPPPSPQASETESCTSTARCRHHPYQRSGAGRINRGGRQRGY